MSLLIGTKTQEEFDSVLSIVSNTLISTYWGIFKEETYIRVGSGSAGSYGSSAFAKAHGEEVTSYEDWAKVNIKPTTKSESSMKYVVEVNNRAEADAVYKLNKVAMLRFNDFPKHITNSGSHNNANEFHTTPAAISTYGPLISFKTFSEMFNVILKAEKTLKLTSDYDAVVNYTSKTVQVGCQTIPFNVVDQLAKLIKE